ncbi:MAG: 2-hydroxyacid dehydrogenase [Hyphomicrobiales bacterium]|nr:2-hydroxyacid dehydrogenase [Hyphomicrobiales bacterium]
MPTPLPRLILDALEQRFVVHRLYEAQDKDAALAAAAPHVRAIATGVPILVEDVSYPITASLMEKLPRLEIVANLGVGYDNVDAAYASAHGVSVTNTPDVLTEETADTAFGLLLNAVRQFPRAERFLRDGKWLKGQFELTASLRGRTMGVLGLGRIGQAIARRAEAFGVQVVYHNRKPVEDAPYRYYASLLDMARDCDILMVVAPGGPATRGLVGKDVLEALGPNGVLVNIARGTIVDEQALIEALRTGAILTAGLDVFAEEPSVPQALIDMEHVVLLPHVGSASQATRDAMNRLVIDNLYAWADGGDLSTPVAETPWRRPLKQAE